MTFNPVFKFIFVTGCLVVAIVSGLRCHSRRDWLWLVGGLGFTVLADYFLVLRDEHLLGVAAFCFAHVCYIFRAVEFKKRVLGLVAFASFLAIWATGVFIVQSVIVVAGLYALLFCINIIVNIKARRPRPNYWLVLAGLILFALCDINVMLFNLPQYMGVEHGFDFAFTLIWVFYLPSQALLAASAFRFTASPRAKE